MARLRNKKGPKESSSNTALPQDGFGKFLNSRLEAEGGRHISEVEFNELYMQCAATWASASPRLRSQYERQAGAQSRLQEREGRDSGYFSGEED